jgi:acyl carrier protein
MAEPAVKHERPEPPTGFHVPESSTERTIATVWEELLGAAPIDMEDDFFELNGDSLLAAQVMSRLQETFAVKLPLSFIFDYPTVRALAAQVDLRRHDSPLIARVNNDPTVYEEGTL